MGKQYDYWLTVRVNGQARLTRRQPRPAFDEATYPVTVLVPESWDGLTAREGFTHMVATRILMQEAPASTKRVRRRAA